MKKILVIAMLSLGVTYGFSQGQVSFKNSDPYTTTAPTAANGHADRLVYYTDNTPLSGTNWYAQLYYATGSGVAASSLHIISGDAPSKFRPVTQSDGIWAGSVKTFSDVASGQTATLQVRVWDGSLYQNYASAADPTSLPAGPHITGESATFNFTAGSALNIPSLYMEGLQSFTLHAAPEPSTIALGLLGAASLLVVRRRK